jgi:hypothetical protein
MHSTPALASLAALFVACASSPSPARPSAGASVQRDAPATAKDAASTCTIDGTPFQAAFAKREDDPDDNAVRIFIFSAAPATKAEKAAVCERSTPIPAFATKSDKHVVEIDFNDAGHLDTDVDVTFLTATTGTAFDHAGVSDPIVELKGSGAAQTLHIKTHTDADDCTLTVPVFTCPTN